MAEGKKGFILYADLIHTVSKMPKEKAGELFITILEYVNDKNPVVDDMLIDLVFEPIKQQLKRDLQKFEQSKERRSEAGKLGGLKRVENLKQSQAMLDNAKQPQANQAVIVNDSVSVNVNDSVSVINNIVATPPQKLVDRENIFKSEVFDFKNYYPEETLNAFFNYWREPNRSKTKMRFELEKTWDLNLRLKKWNNNNFKNGNKQNDTARPFSQLSPI
jgi:hypothetical protein